VPSTEVPASELLPLFLKLQGRRVLVVGGGPVATAKTQSLVATGARVELVAPELTPALAALCATHDYRVFRRPFAPADVEGAWLVIAAAPPAINRAVSEAADAQQTFVVAVDDPASATAYGGGVVRRAGVTFAISTEGAAPAMAGLLREGFEAVIPEEKVLAGWMGEATRLRPAWRASGVPMADRRPLLLAALNRLHEDWLGRGDVSGGTNPGGGEGEGRGHAS